VSNGIKASPPSCRTHRAKNPAAVSVRNDAEQKKQLLSPWVAKQNEMVLRQADRTPMCSVGQQEVRVMRNVKAEKTCTREIGTYSVGGSWRGVSSKGGGHGGGGGGGGGGCTGNDPPSA